MKLTTNMVIFSEPGVTTGTAWWENGSSIYVNDAGIQRYWTIVRTITRSKK